MFHKKEQSTDSCARVLYSVPTLTALRAGPETSPPVFSFSFQACETRANHRKVFPDLVNCKAHYNMVDTVGKWFLLKQNSDPQSVCQPCPQNDTGRESPGPAWVGNLPHHSLLTDHKESRQLPLFSYIFGQGPFVFSRTKDQSVGTFKACHICRTP